MKALLTRIEDNSDIIWAYSITLLKALVGLASLWGAIHLFAFVVEVLNVGG